MQVHYRTEQHTAARATLGWREVSLKVVMNVKKSPRKGNCSPFLAESQSFKAEGPEEALDLWPRLCPVIATACCAMGRRAGLT